MTWWTAYRQATLVAATFLAAICILGTISGALGALFAAGYYVTGGVCSALVILAGIINYARVLRKTAT